MAGLSARLVNVDVATEQAGGGKRMMTREQELEALQAAIGEQVSAVQFLVGPDLMRIPEGFVQGLAQSLQAAGYVRADNQPDSDSPDQAAPRSPKGTRPTGRPSMPRNRRR